MANYIDSILVSGEQVLHRGQISLLSMLPAFIGGGLLVLLGLVMAIAGGTSVVMLLGVVWIGVALLKRLTTELAVTNRRVVAKTGVISRNTVELNLNKVESVSVHQSMLGRLFGYGSIVVKGTGGDAAPIPFIAEPLEFKRALTTATDAAQQAR